MGMYIFSKAIKADEVMAAFGSKNETLFEKIKQSEDYDCYNDQPWEGCVSMEEALHHIIFGEAFDAKSAHVYGYAFIALCDVMGQKVPYTQELKLGYETDLVTQYLESDFGLEQMEIEEYLFEDTIAQQMPEREDFPMIGFIANKELTTLYNKLPNIELSDDEIEELWDGDGDDDEDKACAYGHIKGIKSNLKFCIDNGLDLVSFCH